MIIRHLVNVKTKKELLRLLVNKPLKYGYYTLENDTGIVYVVELGQITRRFHI